MKYTPAPAIRSAVEWWTSTQTMVACRSPLFLSSLLLIAAVGAGAFQIAGQAEREPS